MKKRIFKLMTIFLFSLIFIGAVEASSKIETKVISNKTEIKGGEVVELTLAFDHFEDIKKGINAYKGTLEYDKNIFENITQANFINQNNWESLKYNLQNNEWVAIRKVGAKIGEDVVKIQLKVKENVSATKTEIKIKNLVTSEGKQDIFLNEAKMTLNIVKEQQVIPSKPILPTKPNTGESNNNQNGSNESLDNNGEETEKPSNPEQPDENTKPGNSQVEKPDQATDSNKEQKEEETNKIKKTTNKFMYILLFILIQLLVIIFLYLRHKSKEKNQNINRSFLFLGIILIEFIGTTVVYAFNFAQKGELNGDSEINYADASLLQLHLVDLKKLPDDKLENADMNGDGKITVTDLSILIQKLENTLDYEVNITEIVPDNASPNKNQEVSIKINGDVSFGASIEKLVVNGAEYKVEKIPNTSEYIFKLNAGSTSELKNYKITEAILDNNKKIKLNESFSIDVLKDRPSIKNYRVEENKDDSKLILLFEVVDENNSIEDAYIDVYDTDQNRLKQEKLVHGENRVELDVEEKKEYIAYIILNFNLSNHPESSEHKGVEQYEKELQLIVDYNFDLSNIKTFKEEKETLVFENGDQVKLVFESTNETKHSPSTVKIGDKNYDVEAENGKFKVTLDALNELGSKTLTIEEVTLSNGKKFELNANNSVTITINKRKPKVVNLTSMEFVDTNNLRAMFNLEDEDEAVSKLTIVLMDANNTEIDRVTLNQEEVKTEVVNKFLNTAMTTKYKIKVFMSYNVTGKDEDNKVDELAAEKEVLAEPRVIVNSITPNKNYVEKGGIVKLVYDVESNRSEDIVKIRVNNNDCIAVKLDNGTYEVTLNVASRSGLYSLTTTALTYSDGKIATLDKTVIVDILKNKPYIENFKQADNVSSQEVTLSFNLKDDENSFINGKAVLTLDGNVIEKEVKKGENVLTFQVEPSRKYTLEIKATYDLDSNTLPNRPNEDNKITDGIIETKKIELIAERTTKRAKQNTLVNLSL